MLVSSSFSIKKGFVFPLLLCLALPESATRKYFCIKLVSKLPETNRTFWENKINNNVIRDRKRRNELKKNGWKVIVIWQCEIKAKAKKERRLNRLIKQLTI